MPKAQKEENAFKLFCELLQGPYKEFFEFQDSNTMPFHYIRERGDGFRIILSLPTSELPRNMARNLYEQLAYELEITDGSAFMSIGGADVTDDPSAWVRRSDDSITGLMTVVVRRGELMTAHPVLARQLLLLLLRTRGADPASHACYMLSRAGVTMSLCDQLGGERFLFSQERFTHCSIEDGLRMAEAIRLLHVISLSVPAQRLCALYTERTYDRQPEDEATSK